MFSFKWLWKSWSGEPIKPPEKDEHSMVTESLMLELEHHCREIERANRERENEERRKKTGVDYSWLISTPAKAYEIPQMERLDLEELCFHVKPVECGKVVSLFRDALLNNPDITHLPKILRACIRQVIDQRPKDESLTEWVTKRTASLAQFKIRPQTRITPFASDSRDVESPCSDTDSIQTLETSASSSHLFTKSQSLPNYSRMANPVDLPV